MRKRFTIVAALVALSSCGSHNAKNAPSARGPCVPLTSVAAASAIAAERTDAPLRASGHAFLPMTVEAAFRFGVDADALPIWMRGVRGATYDHAGSATPGRLGVGSGRSLNVGGAADREVVTHYDPPTVIAYAILEGPPLTKHVAVMRFQPAEGGALFSWYQYFEPERVNFPRQAQRFVNGSLNELARRQGGHRVETCTDGY
ncbi:MAG: SRPBCC family protein [Parvularculaceae bacterium]